VAVDRRGSAGRERDAASDALASENVTSRDRMRATEHQLVEAGLEHVRGDAQRLRELTEHGVERLRASTTARVWSRLNAIDFMNSSIQFAALALLCLFPFLILVAAEAGGDLRPALIRRLGLDRQAAQDISQFMSRGTHAAATLDVLGALFVLFGAIGIASTLQSWYERVYEQSAHCRWTRKLLAQLLWLVGFVAYLGLQDLFNRVIQPLGGRVATYAVFFGAAVAFYWWTQHVLLLGRVRWRQLAPGALATGVCLTGLGVFSAFVFSSQIVSGDRDYGSIGVVIVLLSYLIGFGVCLHLGAVAGQAWNEQRGRTPTGGAAEA
jgi:membrane protein